MNKRYLILFLLVLLGAWYSGAIIVDINLHMLSQYLGKLLFDGVLGNLIATLILGSR